MNLIAQMERFELSQVVYTDFTEFSYAHGCREAGLVPIIGHTSKLACGWAAGKTEAQSLFCEAKTLGELAWMAEKRIVYYNVTRRHSSLNHAAPLPFIKTTGWQRSPDCTGFPPRRAIVRVHSGAPQGYRACPGCGALRQESYAGTAIIERHWHDEPKGALPKAGCQEAVEVLAMPGGEQLAL